MLFTTMIKDIIHIGTTSKGGMSTVVNSYIRVFNLPDRNYWSSHKGNFALSLLQTFIICLRVLFGKNKIFHIHLASNGSIVRKFIISLCICIRNKKYVVHLHGGDFTITVSNSNCYNFLSKFILNHSSGIICITEDMKEFIINNFDVKDKIHVIPNFCETSASEPLNLESRSGSVRIVYCGHFAKNKGVFDLIEAFEQANFDYPTTLDLYGGGSVPRVMSKNVNVKGWVNHSEYLELLPNYDFLVLPSKYETFGLAYVEAMGLGIPVIGTFGPSIPEIVTNNVTGILINFGDIKQLITALEKLSNDKELRVELGKNAWLDMKSRFSPETILRKLENLYQNI